jgi:hypothetical protein
MGSFDMLSRIGKALTVYNRYRSPEVTAEFIAFGEDERELYGILQGILL